MNKAEQETPCYEKTFKFRPNIIYSIYIYWYFQPSLTTVKRMALIPLPSRTDITSPVDYSESKKYSTIYQQVTFIQISYNTELKVNISHLQGSYCEC